MKFAPDEDKKKAALEKFNGKLDGFIKNIEKILQYWVPKFGGVFG